ncbi:oxidoreductase [Granulicoccus sp. GXG6511]|uniref:oxidoreductase n=1 Tax=Granulicoccus sp. GXG6511 TaxID=3381351 RepID=UPI003D7DB27F
MTDPLLDLSRLEGVPSAVAAARAAADVVLRDRGARRVPAEVSARALLASARASAAMEGPEWDPGAVRLSTELIDLAEMIRSTPAQALARAHALLARGVVDDESLGRVPADDPTRLQGVLELLTAPTGAPALVVAAIAHAEVALLADTGGGHGVLARAVEHMVLVQSGVDPRAVLVVAEGHRAVGAAYAERLAAYATGTPTGVRDWILHCAQAVTHGAELSPLGGKRA